MPDPNADRHPSPVGSISLSLAQRNRQHGNILQILHIDCLIQGQNWRGINKAAAALFETLAFNYFASIFQNFLYICIRLQSFICLIRLTP
jgi:hypothetical protein